jgi:hypothetical protein
MVVSTIAFGSGNPAATASSNHRANCVIGEPSSISNVNALSINENLSMLADYHDRDQRRFNRNGGQGRPDQRA